jgi:parallel beta-helix repeat protein
VDEAAFIAGRSSRVCYVAKTGNDANPGTKAKPWLTIRHAANTVVAGDTVLVGSGTYDDGDTMFFAGAVGTASAPIVFKSLDRRAATITTELYFKQKHYVMQGFRLLYSRRWASQAFKFDADSCALLDCEVANRATAGVGVLIGSGYHHGIRVDRNYIHGFVSHGIYANQMRNGEVTHNIVEGNQYGIHAYPSVESSEISYNLCRDNRQAGIVLHGYNNRVAYNICYRNGQSGVYLYSDRFFTENYGNDVRNNTCYDNNWCGIWVSGHGPNSIRNNISLGNRWCDQSGQLFIDTSAATRVTLDRNCYWSDGDDSYGYAFCWNGTAWQSHGSWSQYRMATGQDSSGLCVDPMFADTASHSFRLAPGSPCLFVGDPNTPAGVDFYGNSTPAPGQSRVSIGAVEYVGLVGNLTGRNFR